MSDMQGSTSPGAGFPAPTCSASFAAKQAQPATYNGLPAPWNTHDPAHPGPCPCHAGGRPITTDLSHRGRANPAGRVGAGRRRPPCPRPPRRGLHRPRRRQAAHGVVRTVLRPGRGPAPVTPTQEPASFASNAGAARGRVVVIVVDVDSMEPGYEKALLDTAGAMVDSLGPADSVGLLLIPGKGIDLTRDHRRVRERLERVRGFASRSVLFQHTISVREAEAIVERRDMRTAAEVVERECLPTELTCRSRDHQGRGAPGAHRG